jgi:hypothetical protein
MRPDAEKTMAIRRATGLPVLEAEKFIQSSSPDLIRRILDAHRAVSKDSRTISLHDPIGDDAMMGAVVRSVRAEVEREVEANHGTLRTTAHLVWNTMRRKLLEEHGIVWYSPAQMNPGSVFD